MGTRMGKERKHMCGCVKVRVVFRAVGRRTLFLDYQLQLIVQYLSCLMN